MEYVLIVVILAVIAYLLTRKKKEKPLTKQPIEEQKEDKKEVIVKPLPTEQKVYWIKDDKKEWGIAKNMPQGLQVFDEQGNCVLDVTDRLTKILGTVRANKANGNIQNDKMSTSNGWAIFISDSKDLYVEQLWHETPTVKVYDGGVKWEYKITGEELKFDGLIIYGLY